MNFRFMQLGSVSLLSTVSGSPSVKADSINLPLALTPSKGRFETEMLPSSVGQPSGGRVGSLTPLSPLNSTSLDLVV